MLPTFQPDINKTTPWQAVCFASHLEDICFLLQPKPSATITHTQQPKKRRPWVFLFVLNPYSHYRTDAPPCTCVKNYSQIWTEGNEEKKKKKIIHFYFQRRILLLCGCRGVLGLRAARPGRKNFIRTIAIENNLIEWSTVKWVHFLKSTHGCCLWTKTEKQQISSDVKCNRCTLISERFLLRWKKSLFSLVHISIS